MPATGSHQQRANGQGTGKAADLVIQPAAFLRDLEATVRGEREQIDEADRLGSARYMWSRDAVMGTGSGMQGGSYLINNSCK